MSLLRKVQVSTDLVVVSHVDTRSRRRSIDQNNGFDQHNHHLVARVRVQVRAKIEIVILTASRAFTCHTGTSRYELRKLLTQN
jgi:hypothetical protein